MKSKLVFTLVFFSALPGFLTRPVQASSSAEILRIGDAYGAGKFDQVDVLRFTFNVQHGTVTVHRHWEWRPSTGEVQFSQENGIPATHSYFRKAVAEGNPALNRQVDAWFINDQYWLLFPLHLVWDNDVGIQFEGEQPLPIPPGKANKMTVTYPQASGGYTPGDSYEIYYGPLLVGSKTWSRPPDKHTSDWQNSDYVFRQWEFHKGGTPAPTMVTTWEKYVRLGPLVIATEHHDASGKFHLWLSDLSLIRKGESSLIQPQPLR